MITRSDPLREALSLRRAMDQLFEQSFVNPSMLPGNVPVIAPMDVRETHNGYEVDVALPGARAEDIELIVDQNTLTIRGYSRRNEQKDQRAQQAQSQQQSAQPQEGQQTQQGRSSSQRQGYTWLLQEIPFGTFERTITFSRPIDANAIQTKLEDGILMVLLPINESSRPKRYSLASGQAQPQQPSVEAGQHQGS